MGGSTIHQEISLISGNILNHINLNIQYYIGNNDSSSALLIAQPLDAINYYSWVRFIRKTLRIKNELGLTYDILKIQQIPTICSWITDYDVTTS